MSLDIRFTAYEGVICPHCGENISRKEINCVSSGGCKWYPILEELGYYVPYEQRKEENDWYGKDMVLTVEQTDKVRRFVMGNLDLYYYYGRDVQLLIDSALYNHYTIVVNADW